MLHERFSEELIARVLRGREAYHPFPTAVERDAWEALPAVLRERLIAEGEKRLGFEWPSLPATSFMEYARVGNRTRYETRHFSRRRALGALVLAECAEGRGRFLDDIINGIWCICEESTWMVPAHNGSYERGIRPLPDLDNPFIDLFAGETAALIAWTHYLLAEPLDAVTPLVSARMRREVRDRIIERYLTGRFYWMGFEGNRVNNWNPWCTSNCLASLLLLEDDPARRSAGVAKALQILDNFLNGYHADGGCDEGPGYWGRAGASLFDCLELLRDATGGAIDCYDAPLIGEIGRFITRAHISGDYFINFADAGARVHLAADLVYRFGRRIGDEPMMRLGASARGAGHIPHTSLPRALPAVFNWEELTGAPAEPVHSRDVWMDGLQVMAARERAKGDRGFYLAAKGGHNAESHNHNDVGQYLVYLDGRPLIIDAGVGTYTGKTFSPERYDIWTMQSAYHNLPTINGVQQQAGRDFAAREARRHADERTAECSFEIAGAYPAEAGVASWRRTCRLLREEAAVEIHDAFTLAAETGDLVLSLMTPCEPQLDGDGALLLRAADGPRARVTFDGGLLLTAIERIPIDDEKLGGVWGDHLYRVRFAAHAPVRHGTWKLRVTRAADG